MRAEEAKESNKNKHSSVTKYFLPVILGLFSLCFFSEALAVCYDPNPIALSIGSSSSGAVCIGSFQKYSFPVVNGRSYKVTVTPSSSNQDPDLYVNSNINVSPATGYHDVCSSANGAGLVDSCSFLSNMTGTVYIAVNGYGGGADGYVYYSVLVEDTTPKPTLTVSKPSMNVGDTIHLTCSVGSAGSGRQLAFFVQNGITTVASYQGNADVNGTVVWTPDPTAGTSWQPSVSIQCRDNSTMQTSAWANVTVSNQVFTPTLMVSKTSMNVGDSVTLTCDLTSGGAGRTIAFFILNGLTTVATQQVVAGPLGTGTWTPPPATASWQPSVSIQCRDESTLTTSAYKTITVSNQVFTPTLTVSKTSMNVGDSVTLTCDLTGGGAGRTIAFFILNGATTVATKQVQANALGTGTWTPPPATASWQPSVSIQCRDESTLTPSAYKNITVTPVATSATLTPLYRLYKGGTVKDHFYTTSASERDTAVGPTMGYRYEKIEGYVSSVAFQGGTALYRRYNATTQKHYYTTNAADIPSGFVSEGIACYIYTSAQPNIIPFYHLYNSSIGDNFYTISEFERDNAIKNYGFAPDVNPIGYVSKNALAAPLAGNSAVKLGGADLTSGNFQPYSHVDFAVPAGKGLPLLFSRTYNSMNDESGPLGPGWDHSYNSRITVDDTNFINPTFASVKWGNGRIDTYKWNSTTSSYEPYCLINGSPSTSCGIYNTLEKAGVSYAVTTKEKIMYSFTFDNNTKVLLLTTIADRNFNYMTLAYDAQGHLARITDSTGRIYTFNYNIYSNIPDQSKYRLQSVVESSTTGLGRSITFDYDPTTGMLTKFYDAENNLTQYTYDADGLLTNVILPRGNSGLSSVTYDPNVRGRVSGYTLDQQKTVLTYPTGTSTNTVFEQRTLADTVINKMTCASTDLFRSNSCTDNANNTANIPGFATSDPNLPTEVVDRNQQHWYYTYNNKGNVLTATSPLNEVTTYTYDAATGLYLTQVIDPEGNITRYVYDSNFNYNLKQIVVVDKDPVSGISTDRTTTIARWTDVPRNGLVQSVTDPRGNVTTYDYDTLGYPSKITASGNKVTSLTYDRGGRLQSAVDPDGIGTSYTYDNLDRIKTITDHYGKVTTYYYDANGNLDSIDDPRPNINGQRDKYFTYTARDQVQTITERGTPLATYSYDETGRLKNITNARTKTWQTAYDPVGNLQKQTTPLGALQSFFDAYQAYDGNSNLKQYQDADGRAFTYTYDSTNRMQYLNAPGIQYNYQYYKNGAVKNALAGAGRKNDFTYTSRGSVSTHSDSYNNLVSYTYNEAGNLKTIVFNGKTTTYQFDERNLLSYVDDWQGRRTSYQYSLGGRLKKILYPNGTYIEYIYDRTINDNGGRLVQLNNKKSDGSCIACYTVNSFDELDAPTGITQTGGLVTVVVASTISLSHDDNNRINSTGFNYNKKGEILTKSLNSKNTTYTWDASDVAGMLTGISINPGSVTKSYTYDALGNRISATRNGATTRYVLDMSGEMPHVIAETNTSNVPQVYYTHGLGLISSILPDGTPRYYHYDMYGNTVALTDASGNVTDQYAYHSDPFAFNVTSQGSTNNPFKFVGRYGVMDEGDNIYFMRARYYDAETGRFLNEDPIGFEGGDLNLYAYVGGNPVVGIDPKGLASSEKNPRKKFSKKVIKSLKEQQAALKRESDINEKNEKSFHDLQKNMNYVRTGTSIAAKFIPGGSIVVDTTNAVAGIGASLFYGDTNNAIKYGVELFWAGMGNIAGEFSTTGTEKIATEAVFDSHWFLIDYIWPE